MANEAMDRCKFEQLLYRIMQETSSSEAKLQLLYDTRGYFSAHQAARILYAYGIHTDKLRAMHILEPRLCRMTCSEARDIIGAFSIINDKIKALAILKRYLCDAQTRDGRENILMSFPFEAFKCAALGVLKTVRSDVFDVVPAGGHQIYASLGALYSQARPLMPHLYGTLYEQGLHSAGKGKIPVPTMARPYLIPSKYTGHPSYAYQRGRDYSEENSLPCNPCFSEEKSCPAKPPLYAYYPTGGPPLGMHQGGTAPTAFQTCTTYNC